MANPSKKTNETTVELTGNLQKLTKFLFGGNSSGKKDVSFTGKAKVVKDGKDTASKMKPLQQGNQMLDMLMKIYQFLNKNYEEDKLHREEQNNFKEAKKLEDEKRHKAFIKAIEDLKKNLGVSDEKTAPTAQPVGFDWAPIISGILDTVSGVKNALSMLGSLLSNPFTIALLGGAAASWFATMVAADPNFQKAFKKENDPYGALSAMSGDSGIAANIMDVAAKTKEEKLSIDKKNEIVRKLLEDAPILTRLYGYKQREYLMEKKGLTKEQVDGLLGPEPKSEKQIEDEEKETATKIKANSEKPLSQLSVEELQQIKDSIVQYGDPRAIIKKNASSAKPYDIERAKKLDAIDAEITKKKSGTTPAATTPKSTTPAQTKSAAPAPSAPPTSKLNTVTTENNTAKVEAATASVKSTTVNNVNSTAGKAERPIIPRTKVPPVRNQEPTFQSMIIYSTRVV